MCETKRLQALLKNEMQTCQNESGLLDATQP